MRSGEDVAMGVRGRAELMRLATLEPLVNLVAAALRTDHLILWACQVFCKPPREGKSVPFHQDGLYWPIEPLRACSAWVALDRSDAENGALQVTLCLARAPHTTTSPSYSGTTNAAPSPARSRARR